MTERKQSGALSAGIGACLPVLSFQPLLQLLLTEHSVLPPQGLLKAWLGLQRLLVAQHRVVVFPQHLCGRPERRR